VSTRTTKGRRIRAGLTGPNAELGKVAAADVARFLLGLERAAARAAMAILGKGSTTGRRGLAIESAVRLRLRSLSSGSIVAELEIPELETDDNGLNLEIQSLGEQAILKTLETARGEQGANPDVANALLMLVNELAVGERYETAWLEPLEPRGPRVVIDREKSIQLRALAEARVSERREDRVVGTLVEADFEKHTARLRTPDGKAMVVRFDDGLADDIQVALRRPAELEGRVSFDPKTSVATSVELRQVMRADQLVLGMNSDLYWRNLTVEQLRLERGVEPVRDLSLLRDDSATAAEVDAFMAAIEE